MKHATDWQVIGWGRGVNYAQAIGGSDLSTAAQKTKAEAEALSYSRQRVWRGLEPFTAFQRGQFVRGFVIGLKSRGGVNR